MAYKKVGWKDYPSTDTPINATNLDHMDAGILENAQTIGDKTKISGIGDGTVAGAIAANKSAIDANAEAIAQNTQSLTELIIQSVIINQNGLYGYIKDCIGSVIYKNKTAFFHIEGEFSGTIDLLFSAFGLNPNLKTQVAIYGATGDLKLLGFSESQKGNKLYVKVGSNTNAIQISTSATDFYGITFAIDFA